MRIVPEWKDYDNEVKNVMKKWQSEQSHAEPVIATPPSSKLSQQDYFTFRLNLI